MRVYIFQVSGGESEGDSMGGGVQMRITIWLFKKVFAVLRVDIFPGGGQKGCFVILDSKGGGVLQVVILKKNQICFTSW